MMKKLPAYSLFAALLLVSCDDSKTSKKNAEDARLVALKEKLETLNAELEAEAGSRARLVAKYEVAIDSLENSVQELQVQLEKDRSEEKPEVVEVVAVSLEHEEETLEASEDEILVARLAAVGETYDKLEVSMGRVYHEVTITGVDEIGVKFSHRDGLARIDFLSLPADWKERFHFNIARFVEAQKKERVAQANWEKSVDEKMAKINEEKRKKEDQERIAELELALAEAKRPINITQVSAPQRRSRSSLLDDSYSTVLYPSYSSSWYRRSSSSRYCPPIISYGGGGVSVPDCSTTPVRPSPVCPTPVVRPPIVRPTPVCPTPISRPAPVTPAPVRSVPVVRGTTYQKH